MEVPITLRVNGVERQSAVEPRLLLVQHLRDNLGLTGAHIGCETSQCGACSVLMDGEIVKSCTVLAVQADGTEITTIEGLAPAGTGYCPLRYRMSGRLMPAASTWISNSPTAGSGTRAVARCSTSGPPGAEKAMWFIWLGSGMFGHQWRSGSFFSKNCAVNTTQPSARLKSVAASVGLAKRVSIVSMAPPFSSKSAT